MGAMKYLLLPLVNRIDRDESNSLHFVKSDMRLDKVVSLLKLVNELIEDSYYYIWVDVFVEFSCPKVWRTHQGVIVFQSESIGSSLL